MRHKRRRINRKPLIPAYDAVLATHSGLAVGGIPAVLLAAFVVKSLPLTAVRWLVVVVVLYTAMTMLRSAMLKGGADTRELRAQEAVE